MSDETVPTVPVPEVLPSGVLPEPTIIPPTPGAAKNDRLQQYLTQPDALRIICRHVSNGGCLIELAKLWRVSYCDITEWLNADATRHKKYREAVQDRSDWAVESVLFELRTMSQADLRLAFDEQGNLKEPSEWPDELAACIAGVDVKEEFDDEGKLTGYTKKIKLWDRLKANELRGKTLALFVERHKHEVTNLEDLIVASQKKEDDDSE